MSNFVRDLAERALASVAGGVLSVVGLDAVNVLNVDWKAAVGVGVGAGVVAVLKGVVAHFVGDPDTAALLPKN
jgi:hypothetical protein